MNFRPIQTLFLALGSIFALLLLVVGVGGYLITGPAPIHHGAVVEVSDDAAASLDRKIEGLRQDIAQASAGDVVSILITEREATSKVAQLAAEGDLNVEMDNVQIHFSDGNVYACAIVDLLIEVQVAVQAEIGVEEGKPDIKIESLYLGRLPIPRTLIGQVMNALMRLMEEELEELPIELERIEMEDGQLIMSGVVK